MTRAIDKTTILKIGIAVFSGVLCFMLSPFGISVHWINITINLPWSIIFPTMASLAYGWRYGLITSISGGALFQFLLWPDDGLANIGTLINYTSFYLIIGAIDSKPFKLLIGTNWLRSLFALLFSISIFSIHYNLLFKFYLELNSTFGIQNSVIHLDPAILFSFFFKDSINFIAIFFVAQTFLRIPEIRKIYLLPIEESQRDNKKILLFTITFAVLTWSIFAGFGYFLLKENYSLLPEHTALAFFVIFTSGIIIAKILMLYNEEDLTLKIKIQKSEERFREMAENMHQVFFEADLNFTKYYYLSPAFEKIWGIQSYEIMKNPETLLNYVHADDREELKSFLNSKIGTETYSNDFRIVRPDKQIKWLYIRAYEIFKKSENKVVVIGTQSDITERKLMEYSLKMAKEKAEESDNLKTQFLLNMSHEIRTPLNAIFGFSQILEKTEDFAEQKNEYCGIIINNAIQLQNIVDNILTISSIETKQEKIRTETFNLNHLLKELTNTFAIQANKKQMIVKTSVGLKDLEAEIITDQTKLRQVLSNLIENAIKFSKEGAIQIGYHKKDSKLEFYIKDTGIGISPEFQEKIFYRFYQVEQGFTRTYGGNGLGLSISKGFIELMGGEIWLESTPGIGSTFYFSIPYHPSHQLN